MWKTLQITKIPTASRGFKSTVPLFPSVRRLLNEYGIEVQNIEGTGKKGRLLKGDVLKYIKYKSLKPKLIPQFKEKETQSTPASQPTQSSQPKQGSQKPQATGDQSYIDEPTSTVRQVIAKRLYESKSSTPHEYMFKEVVIDELMSLRKEINDQLGIKLSVNDFIIKAVATTLENCPSVNVLWDSKTMEAKPQKQIDISVAVATPGGLITPIVKNANHKGLKEINAEVKTLAEKAKQGKLAPNEFQGGTFTISNLGMFGISEFTSIINPPQAAIMSVGSSQKLVMVDEATNMPIARTVLKFTLNYDARAIDSNVAAQFLEQFGNTLKQPL